MNKVRFILRAAAQRDLDVFADYFESKAGKELALRFIDASRASFAALGDNPNLGPTVSSQITELGDIRKWHISGFPNYLIFYRPEKDSARIFRILHGAQDWWAMLDIARDTI